MQCFNLIIILPALCAAHIVKYVPVDEGTHLREQGFYPTNNQAEDFQLNSRWSSDGLYKEDHEARLATSGGKSKVLHEKLSKKRNPRFWLESGDNDTLPLNHF